ncbi:hypothetical protein Lal_00047582 [Lupinus albus]|uniref:Putative Late embryogenesis abundant protein, LEA-14 n=1 Tax=Lupinus albus TaxID=3870 RepID=A0A6A5N6G5_LUPAL|nr:putative Late embryogenesis abundant protein, LEA-14 [Lupinus albus]KAF1878910.1 hypothetical protein Lal_00047582 [Lupinus albus]
MYNNDHIHNPHVPNSNPKPLKRHHTTQYYMQRVQDSLTTRISKIFCSIFLSLLFIVGLIAFIFWLSLRPHRPRFFINEFSIPGLDQESGFLNPQITFKVTARNSNQNVGVYYESMSGSVFYKNKKIGSMPLLFPFYQDHKTTTSVDGTLGGARLNVSSQRWAEFQHDRAHGNIVFRLELTSVIRFRISTWDSKRHTMHADCNVVVGPNGHILPAYRNVRCPVYFS